MGKFIFSFFFTVNSCNSLDHIKHKASRSFLPMVMLQLNLRAIPYLTLYGIDTLMNFQAVFMPFRIRIENDILVQQLVNYGLPVSMK